MAINQASGAASEDGGGIVGFPPGRYVLASSLTVDRQDALFGAGWASRDPTQGSWNVVRQLAVNLVRRGQETRVESLGLTQEQPAPDSDNWHPANHM